MCGLTRRGLWWADELAADPRFALVGLCEPEETRRAKAASLPIEPVGDAGASPVAAAAILASGGRRPPGGGVVVHVPPVRGDEVRPGELVHRPGRFTAGFAALAAGVAQLADQGDAHPRAFTFVSHSRAPRPSGAAAGDAEHGTAADRLEAAFDALLALSGWTAPRVAHAERRGAEGEEETLRAAVADEETGGAAWLEIVRGAAVGWEPGWSVRTPAGGFAGGTLGVRLDGGELAPRPWPPERIEPRSPLDALHAHLTGGEAWPVTPGHTAGAFALIREFLERPRT